MAGRPQVYQAQPLIHNKLYLQDQYIEISSVIPASATLYGLGENAPSTGLALRRDGIPYALWTRDQAPNVPDVNDYGAHPFILDVRPGRNVDWTLRASWMHHGVVFRTS